MCNSAAVPGNSNRKPERLVTHTGAQSLAALDTSLVEGLLDPAAFEHATGAVEMIETHISWVILAGEFVYKIKKPVVLDFLDFQTLERRKFYCEEELRLNRPWAPDIYLDVVPVTLADGQPRFGGAGNAVEYAVRMRRFDQQLRLDRQLELGRLSVPDMKELGRNIAMRHASAPVVAASQRERVLRLTNEFMWDNFAALDGHVDIDELELLQRWTERELQRLQPTIGERFDEGFFRDCHGDLHLANLVRLPDGITTFDCIEFNTDLRHIDVICDIAFLTMDLVARERHDLAAHFINRYLECSGDYAGVSLLSLYFVYRCLVRAKVAAILSAEHESEAARQADLAEAHRYCDMARRQAATRAPVLVLMSGLSGSGKTRVSGQLMAALPAIRIRADLERKRMFGLRESDNSASPIDAGIYTRRANEAVYRQLLLHARSILESGHHVILDAAFLKSADRTDAVAMAAELGLPAVLLQVTAPEEVLRERLQQRRRHGGDASEAGLDVLDHQLATAEPLTDGEMTIAISCDNSGSIDAAGLATDLRDRVRHHRAG